MMEVGFMDLIFSFQRSTSTKGKYDARDKKRALSIILGKGLHKKLASPRGEYFHC